MRTAIGVGAALLGAAWVAVSPGLAACRTAEDGGPRYVVEGGIARDRLSGLEWQRCALGTTFEGGACTGKRRYVGLDPAQQAAAEVGPGWRVPEVKELYELLDEDCGQPMVDPTVFPDIGKGAEAEDDDHWTATPVGIAELWYFVNLGNGTVDGHSHGFSLAVRLVRSPK